MADKIAERIVICEGKEDLALFNELTRVRGLPEFFAYPIGNDGSPGISSLLPTLIKIVGLTGFKQTVKHVVLLADADDDAAKSFDGVVSQIKQANNSDDVGNFYSVPKKIGIKATGNSASFTVLLHPDNSSEGALEALLWQVLTRKYPDQTACVEAAIACSGINDPKSGWNVAKRDKARVHAAIAMINRHNPAVAISWLWKREPDLIPVSEAEFNDLYSALAAV